MSATGMLHVAQVCFFLDPQGREPEQLLEDWRSLESRLDLAFCAVDMAHVLPNEEITREAVAEARSILTEIGGVALLERLDAATSASTPAQASSS